MHVFTRGRDGHSFSSSARIRKGFQGRGKTADVWIGPAGTKTWTRNVYSTAVSSPSFSYAYTTSTSALAQADGANYSCLSSSTSTQAFPIDIIDTTNALALLGDLVHPPSSDASSSTPDIQDIEETKRMTRRREEDAELILSVLLDVHAKEGNERVFGKIMAVIYGKGVGGVDPLQLHLLKTLGHAYASSGHISLVQSELIPALREQMDSQVVEAYSEELEEAAARRAGVEGEGVFEEILADYPNPLNSKGKENMMDVVERTLPALLPFSANFSPESLFESPSDASDYPLPSSSSLVDSPSASVLEDLVAKGEMERATGLLREMIDIGITVPTKGAYGLAALNALKRVDVNLELEAGAKEEFLMWFDLFPRRWELDSAEHMATLAKIEARLLRSPILDLPLIAAFSKVSAKKGYGRRVIRAKVFRTFVRTATAERDVWESCLKDFVEAAMTNANVPEARKNVREGSEDRNDPRRLAAIAYGDVIYSLVACDRIQDALRLIQNTPECPTVLPPRIYQSILRHLELSSFYSKSNYFDIFASLADNNFARAKELNVFREQRVLESFSTLPKSSLEMALSARDAEGVYRAMEAKSLNQEKMGPISFVVDFLGSELGGEFGGEMDAQARLTSLWETAFRTGAGGSFVLAEMMLYHTLGLWELVLESFVAHFWVLDVQSPLVAKRLKRIWEDKQKGQEAMRRVCVPYVTDKSDVELLWLYEKWVPTRAHTNLVWNALAHLAARDGWEELEVLYKHLLDFTRSAKERSVNARFTNEGAFTTFLRLLARIPVFTQAPGSAPTDAVQSNDANARMIPQRALDALTNMRQLGIPINIYHYTEVGGILARAGDVDGAMRIARAVLQKNNREGKGVDKVFFSSLMRTFLAGGTVNGARKVFDLMQGTRGHAYVHGEDPMLDDVVRELRQREGRNQK